MLHRKSSVIVAFASSTLTTMPARVGSATASSIGMRKCYPSVLSVSYQKVTAVTYGPCREAVPDKRKLGPLGLLCYANTTKQTTTAHTKKQDTIVHTTATATSKRTVIMLIYDPIPTPSPLVPSGLSHTIPGGHFTPFPCLPLSPSGPCTAH